MSTFNQNLPAALNSTVVVNVPNGVGAVSFNLTVPSGGTISFYKSYEIAGTPRASLQLFSSNTQTKIISSNINDYIYGYFGGVKALVFVTSIAGISAGFVSGSFIQGTNYDFQYEITNSGSVGDVNLVKVGGSNVSLGQTTMINSIPITLASNQTDINTNVTQINGLTPDMGSGTVSANTLRITQATDVDVGSNLRQINGSTVSVDSGINGTGVQRVTIATNQGAITSQLPATIGTKTSANSLSVVLASDQASVSTTANITQINGLTPDTGSGAVSANTLRITQATGVTVPVSLSGNQAINLVQLNGNLIHTNTGASGAGTIRVAVADSQLIGTNQQFIAGTAITGGLGLATAGSQRMAISYDSADINKYNIARNLQTNKSIQLKSQFSVTAATTYTLPVGFDTSGGRSVYSLCDGETIPRAFYISSDTNNANNRNRQMTIIGYGDTGQYKTEKLLLNGSDSTTQVITVNTYLGISKFYVTAPTNALSGYVYISPQNVAGTATTLLNACINGGGGQRYANISWLNVPAFYDLFLTELTISKSTGTLNHSLILYYNSALTGQTNMIGAANALELYRWSISGDSVYKYDGFKIDQLDKTSHNSFLFFAIIGSGIDTATCDIHASFVATPAL